MAKSLDTFFLPSRIERTNILEIIGRLACVFDYSGQNRPNFFLNFDNVKKIDALGVLVLYKLLEYSVTHQCFKKPLFNLTHNNPIEQQIEKYGFSELITKLMDNKTKEQYYKNLTTLVTKDFILAPVAMLKDEETSSQKTQALKDIVNYYGSNDISTMILQLFSELFLNYISHSENDNKSVIVVHGNKHKIEFGCADNGIGIIASLRANPRYKNVHSMQLLRHAVERGVTSKENTDHVGYGLYYINEVVSRLNGQLLILTDEWMLQNTHGKINVKQVARWKGTLLSINIPLTFAVTINDIEPVFNPQIKVNFV